MHAWDDFLAGLEAKLGKETISKWLRSLKVIKFDAQNLYLEATDSFQIIWFEEHIRPLLKKHLINNNNRPIRVHLTTDQYKAIPKEPNRIKTIPKIDIAFGKLELDYNFESYHPIQKNLLPYRLLLEIIEKKSKSNFNPIFLYGQEGAGKTHLLQACALALKAKGINCHYVKAQAFTDHVVNAMRSGAMEQLRAVYRSIDVLIIDDIHILANKNATQEEFFHTFNFLHTSGKQMILSANAAPGKLENIAERLISRFEWGICLPIEAPMESADLKALLELKAKSLDLRLEEEAKHFLITQFHGDLKGLHKAISALVLRLHIHNNTKALTAELLQTYLHDIIAAKAQNSLTESDIIKAAAAYYGMKNEDVLGKSQTKECALPRQIAMYLCRKRLNLPFVKIGKTFGRDHSTVMSAVRQIQKLLDSQNREIQQAIFSVLNKN